MPAKLKAGSPENVVMQVKSVLSAALYPNVAVMDDGAGPNARPTWHDGQGGVVVHPSSVNHPLIAMQYMRPYLIYLEKVRVCPCLLCNLLASCHVALIGMSLRRGE